MVWLTGAVYHVVRLSKTDMMKFTVDLYVKDCISHHRRTTNYWNIIILGPYHDDLTPEDRLLVKKLDKENKELLAHLGHSIRGAYTSRKTL